MRGFGARSSERDLEIGDAPSVVDPGDDTGETVELERDAVDGDGTPKRFLNENGVGALYLAVQRRLGELREYGLGECEWHRDSVGVAVLDALTAVAPEVRWRGADRTVTYAVFSRSGFTDDLEQVAAQRDDVELFTPTRLLAVFREATAQTLE